MDFYNNLDDINEEEDETEVMYGGRDGVIFLVDSTRPMFEKGDEKDVPFKTCMECCKTTMLNKIIGSDRDLVSVILFGTLKTENQLNVQHITTLQELSEPSAAKIKQLEKMINSDNFDGFADEYGHSTDFAFSDALWLCQTLFATSSMKLGSYRILLLTNTSDPHVGNQVKQHTARVRATDLSQAGIQLELLHMGANFDASLFYKELVQLAKGDDSGDDFVLPDPTSDFDELLEQTCRLDYKKRALSKLHFNLGDNVTLAVNLYNLVRKSKMPKKATLERATNEIVKTKTQFLNSETSEVLIPAEMTKGQIVADRTIMFRSDEIRSLVKITSPGLQLLGFKPASCVKNSLHYKASAFIYPDEGMIQGSRTLFLALLEKCTARSVVPICYMTPRQNSAPQLVALLPQLEKMNRAGSIQKLPPGFHVIYLPYADSIRSLPIKTSVHATPQQIETMSQITSSLQFNYDPSQFDNPRLQKIWSNIEALALDHDKPREVDDYTRPDYEQMKEKLRGLSSKFLDDVYPAGYDPMGVKKKPAYKRPANGAVGTAGAAKTSKVTATNYDVAAMARNGTVGKLTVAQLKAYLSSVGVQYAANTLKAGLVDLVIDHCHQNN